MKKNSAIDFLGYILFKFFGPIIRNLPLNCGLFLARRAGDLFYYFDFKHKAIAHSNLKKVFGAKLSPAQLKNLVKDFYRTFAQNIIEIFYIPLIDKEYIKKYITIEGMEHINEGFKKGKGIIFIGMHAGSWELSNIVCANLGIPFSLFVRGQRHPRLNKLLNSYRRQKGCNIIQKGNQLRQVIEVLKNNESIGMTVDQAGKDGIPIKFFGGKDTSVPVGAIKLALKYDSVLLPFFAARIKGPYLKFFVGPPIQVKKSGNLNQDIRSNLEEIIHIFEKYILKYPKEYLWSYRIWKYANEKNILILSDAKPGHLKQSEAVKDIIINYLKTKGLSSHVETVEIKYKNKFARYALTLSSVFSGKYLCQGCLWCLRSFLSKQTYYALMLQKPDVVISCGSGLEGVNFIVSRQDLAKSIVIMRPAVLSIKRFDLAVISAHDRPARRKNIALIEGALNSINEKYLDSSKSAIAHYLNRSSGKQLTLGLLLGGNSKGFKLKAESVKDVISQIKRAGVMLDAEILATTSRRTPVEIEGVLKDELAKLSRLLVIANENNIPDTVGGILALSDIVITSPESISMISEAVSSKKYVLVFDLPGLSSKHRRFLRHFARNKYIYLVRPPDLSRFIEDIWRDKPAVHTLKDNLIITQAITKIL